MLLTEWSWKWLRVWWWRYCAQHANSSGSAEIWWLCRSCLVYLL